MVESKFEINNFDQLDEETQQEIEDFVSGLTHEWRIEMFNHCDWCSEKAKLNRIDAYGSTVRVCDDCASKTNVVPLTKSRYNIKEMLKYKKFHDHIKSHFEKQHPEWEVMCKICNKTFSEIVGDKT